MSYKKGTYENPARRPPLDLSRSRIRQSQDGMRERETESINYPLLFMRVANQNLSKRHSAVCRSKKMRNESRECLSTLLSALVTFITKVRSILEKNNSPCGFRVRTAGFGDMLQWMLVSSEHTPERET